MLTSMSPQSYYNQLPTQAAFRDSLISALGYDPADANAYTLNSFPRALDPSRILTAGFSRGGTLNYVR